MVLAVMQLQSFLTHATRGKRIGGKRQRTQSKAHAGVSNEKQIPLAQAMNESIGDSFRRSEAGALQNISGL
jgi:hypothetical protein